MGGSERFQEENKQIELFGEMFEALFGAIYLHYDRILSPASDWLINYFIKDSVDDFLQSNQILEESSVDYLQAISSLNIDESLKLLKQMKQEADALVVQDEKLQSLLSWIDKKSSLASPSYKHTQVRAFYLALIRIFILGFVRNSNPTENINSQVRTFFDSFNRVNNLGLELSFKLNSNFDPANIIASIFILDIEPELKEALQELKIGLPNPKTEQLRFSEWRQAHGQNWLDRIKQLIGYDLVLNKHQKELLKQYYNKNLLLMDCINESQLAIEEKQEIEKTLFLPTQSNDI